MCFLEGRARRSRASSTGGPLRWDNLKLDDTPAGPGPASRAPALFERGAVTRTFDTPGFRGITFYEIHARSIINKVPTASRVPFRWTINPYRGCSHSCVYCFARNTPRGDGGLSTWRWGPTWTAISGPRAGTG